MGCRVGGPFVLFGKPYAGTGVFEITNHTEQEILTWLHYPDAAEFPVGFVVRNEGWETLRRRNLGKYKMKHYLIIDSDKSNLLLG